MEEKEHELALKCLEDMARRFGQRLGDAQEHTINDPDFLQAHILDHQFNAVYGLLCIMDDSKDHAAAYEAVARDFRHAGALLEVDHVENA
jgi:hypothetical protein